MLTCWSAWSVICAIQLRTLLNVRRSVMSYTSTMPCAPLKYERVIVRNCSWPAVSQIWSFTFFPLRCTVLILKSMPIVVMNVEENVSLA